MSICVDDDSNGRWDYELCCALFRQSGCLDCGPAVVRMALDTVGGTSDTLAVLDSEMNPGGNRPSGFYSPPDRLAAIMTNRKPSGGKDFIFKSFSREDFLKAVVGSLVLEKAPVATLVANCKHWVLVYGIRASARPVSGSSIKLYLCKKRDPLQGVTCVPGAYMGYMAETVARWEDYQRRIIGGPLVAAWYDDFSCANLGGYVAVYADHVDSTNSMNVEVVTPRANESWRSDVRGHLFEQLNNLGFSRGDLIWDLSASSASEIGPSLDVDDLRKRHVILEMSGKDLGRAIIGLEAQTGRLEWISSFTRSTSPILSNFGEIESILNKKEIVWSQGGSNTAGGGFRVENRLILDTSRHFGGPFFPLYSVFRGDEHFFFSPSGRLYKDEKNAAEVD